MKPIISANSRIRHPEHLVVGDDSIIDDFCYISTRVQIGRCTHIASGCTIGGGAQFTFSVGDFSSISAGVRIWCTSDDFVNDVVTILPPGAPNVKANLFCGDVRFGHYTAVGANSVVLPKNHIPEGTVIGALSFVPFQFDFKPWSVYAGNPLRYLGPRNRESVLAQVAQLEGFLEIRK